MAFNGPTKTASTATLGKDYMLYVNTGASEASPTWTLIGGLRSNDLTRKADTVDASDKTTGGDKVVLAGLRSWEVALEAVAKSSDAGCAFLESAYDAGAEVQCKFERPDLTYRTGWGFLTEFSYNPPHDGVCTLKGTISGDGGLSAWTTPPAKT